MPRLMPSRALGVRRPPTAGRRADTGTFAPGPGRLVSPVVPPVATASAAMGVLLLVSAGFALADGGRDLPELAGVGALALAVGVVLRRRFDYPPRQRPAMRALSVFASWVTHVGWAVVVYLLTGTLERGDDALFEAVAGLTTTSATVIRPVEAASEGVLVFRGGTQWLGGLTGLLVAVVVLPGAAGGRAVLSRLSEHTSAGGMAPEPATGIRRVLALYGAGTLAVLAGYLVAGMGPVDATAHALSTVSTGGFSTRSGSIAAFDSAAVEWVAVAGMLLGGTSLVVVWWMLRGPGPAATFRRSTELRVYLAVVAAGSVLLALWTEADGHTAIRRAVFTAVSASSTTGFRVADWDAWIPATHALLLVLVAVGAMSSSTSGGVRIIRLLGLVTQMRREVVRQRYPHSVQAAKVDGEAVPESSLYQMVGYEFTVTTLVAATAVAVAALGATLTGAISLSVSALSTFGPGIGSGGAFADALVLPAPARAALLPAMALGRFAVVPLLLVVGLVLRTVREQLRIARRIRRARGFR